MEEPTPPNAGEVYASPFNVDGTQLCAWLTSLTWEGNDNRCVTEETMLLPTCCVDGRPLPLPSHSFLLIHTDGVSHAEKAGTGPVPLKAWRVTLCALGWKEAFLLLGRVQGQRMTPDCIAAEDLCRLAELFRYVGACVSRGAFLPTLRQNRARHYEAWWAAAFDRREEQRLRALAARLPPVATGTADPDQAARAFVDEMLDRLVRVSVTTTLSRAQAERGKHYSAHDAWFSALRGEERRVRWDDDARLPPYHQSRRP